MENLKSALAAAGFNFKKRLGQNFVEDEQLLGSIARAAEVCGGDTVVEIGCGAGTLTRVLASQAKRVLAFEVDPDLRPVLARTLAGVDNAEVIFRDFLKIDMRSFERSLGGEYKIVANLPYYVTTPMIMKVFEEAKNCVSMTVMVQEEVAERLAAKCATPEYGAITAVLALKYDARIVARVPRAYFTPQPNVDSAVVKLTLREPLEVRDPALYVKLVRAAFLSRRKTLENNLIKAFGFTRWQARSALENAGVKEGARGETLSPEEFARLADLLNLIV